MLICIDIEYQPCTEGQCNEPTNIVQFQEFSRLELPRLVRRTLEVAVEEESQPLEDKLKDRLVDIVRECQTQLIFMFQTMQSRTIDASELNLTLVEPAGTHAPHNTQITEHSIGDPAFQDFDSYALAVTSSDFIPIPAIRYQPRDQDQQKQEASDSPDSGYDSTWTNRHAPPLQQQQQQQEARQAPPPFQLDAPSYDTGYFRNQQENFIQEQGFSEAQYVDLEGYYGSFEAQDEHRGVNLVGGAQDLTWPYLDSAAGGRHAMDPRI